MTDVRLTATTTTGEVVYILANAKGELKLEEPIAPPEFDGNLDGDLNVTGSAEFAGTLQVGGDPFPGTATGFSAYNDGSIVISSTSGGSIFRGYTTGTNVATSTIFANGAASFVTSQFSIEADAATEIHRAVTDTSKINVQHTLRGGYKTPGGTNQTKWAILADGGATFKSDVVIGSRGTQWLIRESNGVAMLIEQTRRQQQPREIKVRDLPRELDLVEAALNEIMGKLKMTPPAGWPVWDGSDNSQ